MHTRLGPFVQQFSVLETFARNRESAREVAVRLEATRAAACRSNVDPAWPLVVEAPTSAVRRSAVPIEWQYQAYARLAAHVHGWQHVAAIGEHPGDP